MDGGLKTGPSQSYFEKFKNATCYTIKFVLIFPMDKKYKHILGMLTFITSNFNL